MSERNVEIAKHAVERLQASDLDGFLDYADPDIEWHSLVLEIEGTFRGHDGVRRWWAELRSVFPDWNPSVVEERDLGDSVLLRVRGIGRGTGGGTELDDDFWALARMADQRIVWYGAFRTEAEAVEAAGVAT